MKLSLITMQGVYNYGSALQTYASQRVFERLGLEVEVVDYYPERMRGYGTIQQLYRDAMHFHNHPIKCWIIAFVKRWSVKSLEYIEIGDNCKFGNNLVIVDHDHNFRAYGNHSHQNPEFLSSPIRIGNNVWVGANVTILRGTTIGDNCVIGEEVL